MVSYKKVKPVNRSNRSLHHCPLTHRLAEERLGQKTLAVSPLRVLFAPVVEGNAMLALSRVWLRLVPILEAPTLEWVWEKGWRGGGQK